MRINDEWDQILNELYDPYHNRVFDKETFVKLALSKGIDYNYIEEYLDDVDNPIW